MANVFDISGSLDVDVRPFDTSMQRSATSAEAAFSHMSQVAKTYLGVSGVLGTFKQAVHAGNVFGQMMADISSITELSMQKIQKSILKMDNVLGMPKSTAETLYETISSGIRGTVEELNTYVETASKTATTIRADLYQTGDAMTTISNAYDMSATEVSKLLDKLYVTVREGKAHGDDLARTLGLVVNNASEAGISLDDLFGAIAILSRTQSTSQSMIGLNQMINALIKPTLQAQAAARKWNIELSASRLQTIGLSAYLKELHDKVGGNVEVLEKMFGNIRAGRAIISLTGKQFKNFAEVIEMFKDSAGAGTEAWSKQVDTASKDYERFRVQSEKAFISIGSDIEGITRLLYGLGEATLAGFGSNDSGITGFAGELGKLVGVTVEADESTQKFFKTMSRYVTYIGAITVALRLLKDTAITLGKALMGTGVGRAIGMGAGGSLAYTGGQSSLQQLSTKAQTNIARVARLGQGVSTELMLTPSSEAIAEQAKKVVESRYRRTDYPTLADSRTGKFVNEATLKADLESRIKSTVKFERALRAQAVRRLDDIYNKVKLKDASGKEVTRYQDPITKALIPQGSIKRAIDSDVAKLRASEATRQSVQSRAEAIINRRFNRGTRIGLVDPITDDSKDYLSEIKEETERIKTALAEERKAFYTARAERRKAFLSTKGTGRSVDMYGVSSAERLARRSGGALDAGTIQNLRSENALVRGFGNASIWSSRLHDKLNDKLTGVWEKVVNNGMSKLASGAISVIGKIGMGVAGAWAAIDIGYSIGKAIAERFDFAKKIGNALFDNDAREESLRKQNLEAIRDNIERTLKRSEDDERLAQLNLRRYYIAKDTLSSEEGLLKLQRELADEIQKTIKGEDDKTRAAKNLQDVYTKASTALQALVGHPETFLTGKQISEAGKALTTPENMMFDTSVNKSPRWFRRDYSKKALERLEEDALKAVEANPSFVTRDNLRRTQAFVAHQREVMQLKGTKAFADKSYEEIENLFKAAQSAIKTAIRDPEALGKFKSQLSSSKVPGFDEAGVELLRMLFNRAMSAADKAVTKEGKNSEFQKEVKEKEQIVYTASENSIVARLNEKFKDIVNRRDSQLSDSSMDLTDELLESSGIDKKENFKRRLEKSTRDLTAKQEALKEMDSELFKAIATEAIQKRTPEQRKAVLYNAYKDVEDQTKAVQDANTRHLNLIASNLKATADELEERIQQGYKEGGIDLSAMTKKLYERAASVHKSVAGGLQRRIDELNSDLKNKAKNEIEKSTIRTQLKELNALYKDTVESGARFTVQALESEIEGYRHERGILGYKRDRGVLTEEEYVQRQLSSLQKQLEAQNQQRIAYKGGTETAEYRRLQTEIEKTTTEMYKLRNASEEAAVAMRDRFMGGVMTMAKEVDLKGRLTNNALFHSLNAMSILGGSSMQEALTAPTMRMMDKGSNYTPAQQAQGKLSASIDAYIMAQKYANANIGKNVESIYGLLQTGNNIIL